MRLETVYRRVNDDLQSIMNFVSAPSLEYIEIPVVHASVTDEIIISLRRSIQGICYPSQLTSLDLTLYDPDLRPEKMLRVGNQYQMVSSSKH
jgi:hypothetical protein